MSTVGENFTAATSSDSAYCACHKKAPWKPWDAVESHASSAVNLHPSAYTSLGIDVRVSPDDRIMLLASLKLFAATTLVSASFTIFRNGVNIVPTSLQEVTAVSTGEILPASLSYFDAPGVIGDFVYSVRAKGDGRAGSSRVSDSSSPRQLVATVTMWVLLQRQCCFPAPP